MFRGRSLEVCIDVVCIFAAIFFLTSCATKSDTNTAAVVPPKSVWAYDPQGIRIQYSADKLLNIYENDPHTLIMAVYQLDNINAFSELVKNKDGLEKLLQVQHFDASAVGMDKIIIQPGQEKTVVLSRAENARWIGIVAGYYSMVAGQVSRLYNIPLITETKGVYGFRKTETRVGQVTIKLFLGPNALHDREVEVK
jgi:type VI secretion system VasD/TssJ family lipoprotein